MGLPRVNLVLAGVVALLALTVLFAPDPARESEPGPLTALDPETLPRIHIHRGSDDTLAFRRTADGWRMTDPYGIAADRGRLQALARLASTPSRRSFPAAGVDLAELGLAPAPLHLELDGLTLEIGGTEPIRGRRYLLLEGRIHLIDDRFQHHLLAAATAFVDRHPFPDVIGSATLDGEPLTAAALHLLNGSRAAKVEEGAAAAAALRLEVRAEGGQAPLSFRLAGDGVRLWREQPPLLYRLEPPLPPGILQD